MTESALSTQVGGDHYKRMRIQPVEFALVNRLNTAQANIIKYVCRYQNKDGARDLEKAHHYCDIWLQVFAIYRLDWSIAPPLVISVDTFVEVNCLPPLVATVVKRVCVAPTPYGIEKAKEAIKALLAGLDG